MLTFYVKVAFHYISRIKLVIIGRHFHAFKLAFKAKKVLVRRIGEKIMMMAWMMQ